MFLNITTDHKQIPSRFRVEIIDANARVLVIFLGVTCKSNNKGCIVLRNHTVLLLYMFLRKCYETIFYACNMIYRHRSLLFQ